MAENNFAKIRDRLRTVDQTTRAIIYLLFCTVSFLLGAAANKMADSEPNQMLQNPLMAVTAVSMLGAVYHAFKSRKGNQS